MKHLLALAQSLTLPGSNTAIEDPAGFRFGTLGEIVTRSMSFIFAFAGFALLLMIIASGFALLTSAGDAKKMESGKQRLTYALFGFIIIFCAFWITQLLGKIFGIDEFKTIFQ